MKKLRFSALASIVGVAMVLTLLAPAAVFAGAQDFTTYVTSPDGQKLIGEYGTAKYGEPLFTANATGTAEFAQ